MSEIPPPNLHMDTPPKKDNPFNNTFANYWLETGCKAG